MAIQSKLIPKLKSVYVGLAVEKGWCYAALKKDEQYVTYQIKLPLHEQSKKLEQWLSDKSAKERLKIVAVGVTGFDHAQEFGSRIWLEQDIVPHFYNVRKKISLETAKLICHDTALEYDEEDRVKVKLGTKRKVLVSQLTGLDEYSKHSTAQEFEDLLDLAAQFKQKRAKLMFINATAAGGGVALMRHALIRLYKLLEVDASWHILEPNADIFNITKKKFHNILQGVASPEVILTEKDKQLFVDWSSANARILADKLKKTDVVVIDDPQPAGLIPHIKRLNPRAKIIYRSHIQISAHLINPKNVQQFNTWKFLWQFIKLVDIFVSHPIYDFVPPGVKKNKLVYLPAATDPVDGLNKKIKKRDRDYYLKMFNLHLLSTGQKPIDPRRPYLIQIARFDPSKGIPDVIESYRKLRRRLLKKEITPNKMPQLVVVGNGSIDDPEGAPIYEETHRMLAMDTYAHLASDVKVARLPHHDQLLNTLLSRSLFAFQLSHKEGFEVKVTEALMKGKPVIAYQSGGIVLQVRHAKTGFLVRPSNTSKVADWAMKLFLDKEYYKNMSKEARTTINHEYLTAANASKWLKLALVLMDRKCKL